MDRESDPKGKSSSVGVLLWRVLVRILALIGFVWLAGGPLLRLLMAPMFVTEVVRRAPSPDNAATAEVEVRKGGFGTVWTTRVHLRGPDKGPWTVYQTKDSDFTPTLRWIDRRTLLVGLPCDRFDHISNPDDWENEFAPRPERLKVRFRRPSDCD